MSVSFSATKRDAICYSCNRKLIQSLVYWLPNIYLPFTQFTWQERFEASVYGKNCFHLKIPLQIPKSFIKCTRTFLSEHVLYLCMYKCIRCAEFGSCLAVCYKNSTCFRTKTHLIGKRQDSQHFIRGSETASVWPRPTASPTQRQTAHAKWVAVFLQSRTHQHWDWNCP